MKRLVLVLFVLLSFSFNVFAGPLPTYDPNKYPETSWQEIQGTNYIVLEVTEDYEIIEIDGKIYVVFY